MKPRHADAAKPVNLSANLVGRPLALSGAKGATTGARPSARRLLTWEGDNMATGRPLMTPDRRLTRRIARLATCCLVVASLWACGPVFIPVPPPSQTTFTLDLVTDAQGNQTQLWIAAGGPEPRASNGTYYIFNQQRNGGVIAGAADDGSYQAPPMPGTEGDQILINYKARAGKLSPAACLLLSEQRPPVTCPPN